MNFFNTLRGRLLVILAFLLVATLGIQYYLNLKTQQENNVLREQQEQAFLAGIALGFNSMTSQDRLQDFVKREGQPFFDEKTTKRIKDIIIINNDWKVYDSLSDRYLPSQDEEGETRYLDLKDLKDLPPLMEGEARLGGDIKNFPNAYASDDKGETDGEAHAIPIETNQGRWYVMVILENDKKEAARRAAQPLVYTLGILLVSTLVTFFFVWRFTSPIANLSKAAKRVAEGDLSFRLKESERTDEIGGLAARFNEMTAELEKKRELEAKFREAEKSAVVGRLASAIAHEIRNPLNYINLTFDYLRTKFTPEEPEKRETFEKLTEQLKAEVGRINQQVSDFLGYSRPIRLDLQPMKIRKVVEDSLLIVEPQAEEQGITVGIVERGDTPPVLGDAGMLRSVFNNLFINAVQSMEKTGGNLSATISTFDDYVKIEVKDKGVGIPEESLEKIFEPYYSTKETGTGLGLAIVKRIVDEHHGFVSVESELGEGTVFTIRLPKARG